ncbi:hypothetical protein JMJ77_0014117, partial [Colletotrichum scovillei]
MTRRPAFISKWDLDVLTLLECGAICPRLPAGNYYRVL